MNFHKLEYLLFLIILQSVISQNWKRRGGNGGDAPFAKIAFSQTLCECANDLVFISPDICANITIVNGTNVTKTYSQTCSTDPFWGVVFTTWAMAAVFVAVIVSTGFRILGDIFLTIIAICRPITRSWNDNISDAKFSHKPNSVGPLS